MVKVGDEVVTKSPLWHHGVDIGDRLGRVISTTGHVIVEIYDYDDNPVKCFRSEIEVVRSDDTADEPLFDDLDFDIDDLFGKWGKP
jgi:hypothetical protein